MGEFVKQNVVVVVFLLALRCARTVDREIITKTPLVQSNTLYVPRANTATSRYVCPSDVDNTQTGMAAQKGAHAMQSDGVSSYLFFDKHAPQPDSWKFLI